MKLKPVLIAALMFAVTASASAAGKHTDYAAYAGPAIPSFTYTKLYNWQRTGDKSVVVWTKPSTAYLLTLRNNCSALTGRVTIEIGGAGDISGKLVAGSGDVVVGQLHCRVVGIQPIDLEAMKRDRKS